MDSFNLIQQVFTQMQCRFCANHFEEEDVQLVREENGLFIVNIHCHQCDRSAGLALVSLENENEQASVHHDFPDPELTPEELDRLSVYNPIGYDDVIDAHQFFNELGTDWIKHIPNEMRESGTTPEEESHTL